jgi:hypothetical protein
MIRNTDTCDTYVIDDTRTYDDESMISNTQIRRDVEIHNIESMSSYVSSCFDPCGHSEILSDQYISNDHQVYLNSPSFPIPYLT